MIFEDASLCLDDLVVQQRERELRSVPNQLKDHSDIKKRSLFLGSSQLIADVATNESEAITVEV